VIGIEGIPGYELVDGTHMTVPKYAFHFDDYGWGWRTTGRPGRGGPEQPG